MRQKSGLLPFLFVVAALLASPAFADRVTVDFEKYPVAQTMVDEPNVAILGGTVSLNDYARIGHPGKTYTTANDCVQTLNCIDTITAYFFGTVSNVTFTLMQASPDQFPWVTVYDDQGHSFNFNLGCANCDHPQPNPSIIKWPFQKIRYLEFVSSARYPYVTTNTWKLGIDDLSFDVEVARPGISVQLLGDDSAPTDTIPVRDTTSISIPVGRAFTVRLRTTTNGTDWVDQPSSFALLGGTVEDGPEYPEETLYPTSQIFQYSAIQDRSFRTFQALHEGSTHLQITTDDPNLGSVTIPIRVYVTESLGPPAVTSDWDIQLQLEGSTRGIPPQYLKAIANHETGGTYNVNAWRYEPNADRKEVAPNLGKKPYSDYVLPAPTHGRAMGPWLCPVAINGGCAFPYVNDVNAAHDHGLQYLRNGVVQPVPDSSDLNQEITIREICEGTNLVQHQNWPCPPPPPRPATPPGRVRPVRFPDNWDSLASPHMASSYGIMQSTWYSVIEKSPCCGGKWHGVVPSGESERRFNPGLLFDINDNIAKYASASVAVGPSELRWCFAYENGHLANTLNPNYATPDDFAAAMEPAIHRYNGDGPDADKYTADVMAHVAQFLAQSGDGGIINNLACASSPAINSVSQPVVIPGSPATLTVRADGAEHYQWYVGALNDTGSPIAGSDSPYLTVTPSGTTSYWVQASNACGSSSGQGMVSVVPDCTPPAIGTVSDDVTVAPNTSTHLTVTATSAETYQWYRYPIGDKPAAIAGANSAAVDVTPDTDTYYYVIATNSCQSVVSRLIRVSVNCTGLPRIISQPRATAMVAGGTAVLSVTASGASTIEWFDASGTRIGSGPSVAVWPAATMTYHAILTNSCGTTTSDDAVVTVTSSCNPVAITTQPSSESYISRNTMIYLGVVVTGTSPQYQWYLRDRMTGEEQSLRGANSATYAATMPGDFFVRVSNSCGTVDSNIATVLLGSNCSFAAVYVTEDKLLTAGQSTTLGAVAVGRGPFTYQWFEHLPDGSVRAIGSDNSVTVTPTNDVTTYHATVTGPCNTATSNLVTITLCRPPTITVQPVAPSFVSPAESEPVSIAVTGTNLHYTWFIAGAIQLADGPTLLMNAPPGTVSVVCVVSNECGTVTSIPITVLPACASAAINTQPQSTSIEFGDSATLSLRAAGDPAPAVKWYSAGTQVGTGTSLTVSPSATTTYYATVTNPCGNVTSANAMVTVNCFPAAITTQPQSFVLGPGGGALAVTATGTLLHYQWYRGNSGDTSVPVGADNRVYTTTDSVTTNYWVRVTGHCGAAADSATAKVSVSPAITAQPVPVNITRGTTATFSVSGSGTQLAYQWYIGVAGDTSNPIAGATSTSYTTPALTVDKTYWVRVYSGSAYTDSTTATATICVNAGWSIASQATGQPSGGAVTLAAVNPDPNSTYAWYQGLSGDTSTPLGTGSSIVIHPTQTTSYWMRATSATCYADSAAGSVIICTPTINTQPASTSVTAGAPVTLSIGATGTSISYQWYIGAAGTTTNPVSGATSSSYTFTAPSATTSYWCRVTYVAGNCFVNSSAATVTVCNAPAISASPQLLTPNAGQTSQLSVTASGVSPSYQWYVGTSGTTTTPFGTNAATQSVGPQQTTDYWVKVTSSCGVVNSPAVKVSVTPIISSQPSDVFITSGTSATFTVAASGAQLSYQWYRGAAGDLTNLISGATNASYTTPALTTNTTYWVLVKSGIASVQSAAATANVCQPPTVSVSGGGAVSGAAVTLSIVNPNGSDTYKWYRGSSGDTSNLLADTGTTAAYTVSPTQDTNYWVRSTGATCFANSATVTVSICTPKITQQPASTGITPPNSAALSVVATGNAPLTYQWYSGTSGTTTNPISGATSSSYTAAPASTSNYWVKVTNGTGGGTCSVNSNTATVTVCSLPSITSQPVNQTLNGPVFSTTLSVGASGATSYRWYAGQPGDTSIPLTQSISTSSASNVGFVDTTYVWVRVTNACGSVNSNAALISVKPAIYGVSGGDIHLVAGSMATFSVNASGSSDHYSWWVNSVQVPNTDSATFMTQINADSWVAVYVTSGTAQNSAGVSASVCDSVHITSGPFKQTSGSSRGLSVSADDPSATYQWYQGPRGVTTTPVSGGASSLVWVSPTTTTTYWCRVTSGDGTGCYTDSASITAP